MFLTRTILTILGLWNPQPDPDKVRKYQTQAQMHVWTESRMHVWTESRKCQNVWVTVQTATQRNPNMSIVHDICEVLAICVS